MRIKPILNKWQLGTSLVKRPAYRATGFLPEFSVWCMKFIKVPEEGYCIEKEHYKGFIFSMGLRHDVVVRAFYIPRRIKFWISINNK